MIEQDALLSELVTYRDTTYPVLSLYLGEAGKRTPSGSELVTKLHAVTKRDLIKTERTRFAADLRRIETYLQTDYQSSDTRGLAFFVAGRTLWRVATFEFPLPDQAVIGNGVYLGPIDSAVQRHRPYLVLLIDRTGARLLLVHLGRIAAETEITKSQVPQRVRAIRDEGKTGRDDKIARHIEDHLHRHLTRVAKETAIFLKGQSVDFIILGGHRELFTKLRRHLPTELRQKIAAEFIADLDLSTAQVLRQSKALAAALARERPHQDSTP